MIEATLDHLGVAVDASILTRTAIGERSEIRPQAGGQEQFLSTSADIAVFGGVAGPGKTFALLMEPLRHIDNPYFGTVIFRRTCPQITNEGGLWDTSEKIYPLCGKPIRIVESDGGIPKFSTLEWVFPSGAKVKFAHMQFESDRFQWDGAQIPLIGYDQLEHFTWKQFFYMLARNRSTCGVIPYIRATCNPNPDHWLRSFMSWWIDDQTGYAISERSGIIRWFVIRNNEVFWADSKKELVTRFGSKAKPKSFTFILGRLHENKILLEENPEYEANLQALPEVDQQRLYGEKGGNWNVRETAGSFFHRQWFEIIDATPQLIDDIRYWDRAAAAVPPGKPKPASWTAGCRMGKDLKGAYYITDMVRFQGHPLEVELALKNTATQDTTRVRIGIEQDPGQAGKAEALLQVRNLAGFNAEVNPVHEAKGVRVKPLCAQAKAGNVKLVRGPWNEAFLREAENFDGTTTCVSDQIDAASGAFHLLTSVKRAGVW